MGTTSKGLRYPEGTVLANTLHTHIKNLADDVNPFMAAHDIRGVPISRHGGASGRIQNTPNDNVARTVHQVQNFAVVPAGAVTAHVSMSVAAQCAANAQVWWRPMFSPVNGVGGVWWDLYISGGYVNSHNQSQPVLNMGFGVSGIFDVRSYIGGSCGLAVNAYNDPGSGGWIDNGHLEWAVTFMS